MLDELSKAEDYEEAFCDKCNRFLGYVSCEDYNGGLCEKCIEIVFPETTEETKGNVE